MKLHLSRIAEGPSRHHQRLRMNALPRVLEAAGGGDGEVEADLHVQMVAEVVEVSGTVRLALAIPCSLCLEPTPLHLEEPFTALQAPVAMLAALPRDQQLCASDLDLDYFIGDEIDLTELLEEQTLLMLPVALTCHKDCQGVCAGCGHNLNHEPCSCPTDTGNHPFAVLRDMLK